MKKIKSIKSIIGIGTIGVIGLGVSAGITSCGKATTTDVVSFSNDYLPSMSRGREQTFHASSSMDGKITYSIGDHPDGVTIEDNILNYSTSATVNENTNVTIIATSDKGGHSSIKITLLADTPTPTLSATIIANDLNLSDLDSFAVLSVTEINTDAWADPTLTFDNDSSSSKFTTTGSWDGTGLTKTTTIRLGSPSPIDGSHTITISATGYESITQTFTVLPATATLVISPTTLADDSALNAACNLKIDLSGALSKKADWDEETNQTFTTYLNNLHITTIKFEGITSIGIDAFNRCTAVTNISLPSSITTIGSSAFYGCSTLTTINFPSSIVSIGQQAFYGCSALKFVDLSPLINLETLGSYAFENCVSLKFIDLPSSLSSIGDNTFFGCTALKFIDLSNCTALTSIDLSPLTSLTTIDDSFLSDCTSLTSIDLSPFTSLTSIASWAFTNCAALTTVDLSLTSLTSIGEWAFEGCTSLITLKLSLAMFASNNTAVIERYAFSNCTALHEIYIPAEVAADLTNGESYAFNNCSASGTIWYPTGKESIATNFKSKFTGLQNWTPSPIS